MINYYLRPDGTQVKIDSEIKTVTNVVNKSDQKIMSHLVGEAYYTRISTDAANWPASTETDYNNARTEVLAYLSSN